MWIILWHTNLNCTHSTSICIFTYHEQLQELEAHILKGWLNEGVSPVNFKMMSRLFSWLEIYLSTKCIINWIFDQVT